ncbi:hypothetical protein B0F90DRAFT_1676958 [Multifurca ochricompacta]|uniref:Rad51-like C-terminal domain-containing protein n=1 Tax=Multifurca ochricompacta TaxID=376703 RepID=A0AAD4MCV1_9AGAM|nr:hypothetical protein B0F90DRAFT_1676958 [Multifurca ochricompacta]
MNSSSHFVESLDEVRLTSPAPTSIPTTTNHLHLSSLHRGDIIEIQGPSGSGKTHLLYYLICSCILPLRFGGWNKVSVVFDTDGTFDIRRLQTLLQRRLTNNNNLPSEQECPTSQVISVALRNVHIFRPKSSLQLAAGLVNLSSYHMSNLPTSEIALLAIDSVSAFYWLDCFAGEQQHTRAHLASHTTPIPAPSINPLQTVLTALRTFRRSHYPIIVIVNWGLTPISRASSVSAAFQQHRQHLSSFLTLMNRTRSFPDLNDAMHLSLTHRVTLNLARVVPFPDSMAANNDEQWMASLRRYVDIHVHVKTAVDHAELLLMRISSEQVVITIADDTHTLGNEEGQQ